MLLAIDWRYLAYVDEMVCRARPGQSEKSSLCFFGPFASAMRGQPKLRPLPSPHSTWKLRWIARLIFLGSRLPIKVVAIFSQLVETYFWFPLAIKNPCAFFFLCIKNGIFLYV